jgi:hypothetical protein
LLSFVASRHPTSKAHGFSAPNKQGSWLLGTQQARLMASWHPTRRDYPVGTKYPIAIYIGANPLYKTQHFFQNMGIFVPKYLIYLTILLNA